MANPRPALLKPREVTVCKQLAASQQADSGRATALLAIHHGATHAVAASESGLSAGQVKYILTRFRRLGLSALSVENPSAGKADKAPSVEQKPSKTKKKTGKDKDKTKAKKDKKKEKKKDKKKNKKDKKKDKKKSKK